MYLRRCKGRGSEPIIPFGGRGGIDDTPDRTDDVDEPKWSDSEGLRGRRVPGVGNVRTGSVMMVEDVNGCWGDATVVDVKVATFL